MNHSPEPWRIPSHNPWCMLAKNSARIDQGEDCVAMAQFITNEREYAVSLANAARIVACVNFCRHFDTEFLRANKLVRLAQDGHELTSLDKVPGLSGLVACVLLPIQENDDATDV